MVGHNTCGGTVKRLCSLAGIPGIIRYSSMSNDQFKQIPSVLPNSAFSNTELNVVYIVHAVAQLAREYCNESGDKENKLPTSITFTECSNFFYSK